MAGCPVCERVDFKNEPGKEELMNDIVFRNNKLAILKIEETIYSIIPRSHMTLTEMMADRAMMGAIGKAMMDIITRTTSVGMLATFHWNQAISNNHAAIKVEVTKQRD